MSVLFGINVALLESMHLGIGAIASGKETKP